MIYVRCNSCKYLSGPHTTVFTATVVKGLHKIDHMDGRKHHPYFVNLEATARKNTICENCKMDPCDCPVYDLEGNEL